MAEDPCMYNDSLKLSHVPHQIKNDIPSTIQVDIFDHLGWHHKRSFRRVCRLWKQLVERPSSVFLLEVHTALSQFKAESARTPRSRFASLLWNVGEYFMPVTFFEPPKRPVVAPELCKAVENCQVLIFVFPAEDCREPRRANTVLHMELWDQFGIVNLIARSKLHHVIWCLNASPVRCVDHLQWVDEVVAFSVHLHFRYMKSITYTMVSSLCFSHHICEIWRGVYCQLVPHICNNLPMPALSFKGLGDVTTIFYRIELGLKKTILPYSEKQLVWLQQCRRLLEGAYDSNFALILDGCCISENRLNQIVASYTAANIDGGDPDQLDYPPDRDVRIDTVEFEQLAVMISLFARMIALGKPALPPPPEHVPLCFVHPNTVVCACASLATSDDPYKLLRAHVISSPRRYSNRTWRVEMDLDEALLQKELL